MSVSKIIIKVNNFGKTEVNSPCTNGKNKFNERGYESSYPVKKI